MDDGATGWMHKTIKENLWRTEGYCDIDDLVQEGRLLFHRLTLKYPGSTAPHMQRLFQTSFTNLIHDISKKRTRLRENLLLESDGFFDIRELDIDQVRIPPETNETLASLPAIVKQLIQAFKTDPRIGSPYRRRLDGQRETTNERLCRIIGADPNETDVLALLREHLSGGLNIAAV